ncbi:unnamed protein product (mitochondrion) [Plasmodiophora brassicae]|uniref:RNA helicase n=1 Tax=Plasmodiophora brassicae TaxID=37360 RepID=A0A3P3YGS7_PLABS|nr:unnamed protein product [Plasmodiophora brassicae]
MGDALPDDVDEFLASVVQPSDAGAAEVDPLDAFMASVNAELTSAPAPGNRGAERLDLEADERSYPDSGPNLGARTIDAIDEHDEEAAMDDRDIALLPLVDHSGVKYRQFRKNILKVHPDVAKMTAAQVKAARESLGVQVHGLGDVAKPGLSFGHLGLSDRMVEAAASWGFEKPTPIQSQAVPVALSGRDVIGVASTGSGKTASFLWPLILHLQAQPTGPMRAGEGPAALVLAPTRELATQIYIEARKYLKTVNKRLPAHMHFKAAGVFGGMQMYQQSKELAAGVDLVVATPGRLLDHLRKKQAQLTDCTFVVIDEADRLLQMGFEAQARAILSQIRPDRQTLLFSATFKRRVESLARSLLRDPVRIAVGKIGAANEDVIQRVEILNREPDKFAWLQQHLPSFLKLGQVLIFAGTRAACDLLARNLAPTRCGVLHGDKSQAERMEVLQQLKKNLVQVVVATDVAARGLDIGSLHTVINFELARDVDSHVHRIGRVGRQGQEGEGTAITLLSRDLERKTSRALPGILASMRQAKQTIPDEAWDIAGRVAPDELAKVSRGGVGSSGGGSGRSTGSRGGGGGLTRITPVTSGLGSSQESSRMSKRFVASGIKSAEELRSQFRTAFTKSSQTLGDTMGLACSCVTCLDTCLALGFASARPYGNSNKWS